MTTTNSGIEGKKPSELMLSTQLRTIGMLETFPCVGDVDYITQDLAVLRVRFVTRWATRPDPPLIYTISISSPPSTATATLTTPSPSSQPHYLHTTTTMPPSISPPPSPHHRLHYRSIIITIIQTTLVTTAPTTRHHLRSCNTGGLSYNISRLGHQKGALVCDSPAYGAFDCYKIV
nr:hypothetical protein [Tanacetum cinerariifolium]